MRLTRITVQNSRSFHERQELKLDGPISIVIGPNGGGKTNLLDTVIVMLRRHLLASRYAAHAPTPEWQDRYEFRQNDVLNNMVLERNSTAPATLDQIVEAEVQITDQDIENMRSMKGSAAAITAKAKKKYVGIFIERAQNWDIDSLVPGSTVLYTLTNGSLSHDSSSQALWFLEYLQQFEVEAALRDEYEMAPLAMPVVYLPVTRSSGGFQSTIDLSGYNDFELKRQIDGTSSKSGTQLVSLAVSRIAHKHLLLLNKDKGGATEALREDPSLKKLTQMLMELGYEWSLISTNYLRNQYDVSLKKQGSTFMVGAASSGERELLTYLFAIYALKVRDALIVVDEPELHLHPRWQKTLIKLFTTLAKTTGNQFLLATHSPTFISADTIQYVSRVYSQSQRSQIKRLDVGSLPESKHLLSIVNTQNNERLFFADAVILVEGISDRAFFESVLDIQGRASSTSVVVEVISVGGKGFFPAYKKLLEACSIPYSIIADLDYVEQVGTPSLRSLFKLGTKEIKEDVIENIKSLDGDALVRSIDNAIHQGAWGGAQEVWEYIKSRRRALRSDLSEEETSSLNEFIHGARETGVFILSRGSLEAYLPEGYASKNIEKLLGLLSVDFWRLLPEPGRTELKQIAQHLLARHGVLEKVAQEAAMPSATYEYP